jgi:site-specific DNA-methyltransferase (adenine-specific)
MTSQLLLPGTTPLTENSRQEAGTPRHIFDVLHAEYRFTVDVCAVKHNAKLPRFMGPADDSLSLHWSYGYPALDQLCPVRAWCNPPFDNIAPWLEHAHEPELACYLLPVRTGRQWWREWSRCAERHYFIGESPHERIQFVPPPGITYKHGPAFDCCLFLFGDSCEPGTERWRSGRTGERL